MDTLYGVIFAVVGMAGPVLTLIGLPGVWLLLAGAAGLEWSRETTYFSWWTIGVCAGLALAGEIVELVGSATASASAGGSRRSAIGAVIGAVVGAIGGAAFPPVIGAVIWGVVGAGVGAILGEVSAGREWKPSLRIGTAAAAGRLISTLVKTGVAILVYLILLVAVLVP